jgi:hypothetical protein
VLEVTLKVRVMRDMPSSSLAIYRSRVVLSIVPPLIAVAVVTREGRLEEALEFFKRENTLDYTLAKLGKPYVVFMEGITSTSSPTYPYPPLILTKLDLFSFSSSLFFFLRCQTWTLQWEEEPASPIPPP